MMELSVKWLLEKGHISGALYNLLMDKGIVTLHDARETPPHRLGKLDWKLAKELHETFVRFGL